jgi:ADP-ribose pyrophosphatase YjhB (NUDIX family)
MPGDSHLIVSALVRRDESLLLVEQQGPWDAEPSWMLPGGRVEADEPLLVALERELAEETGLALDGIPTIAFAVDLLTVEGWYSALTFDCRADGILGPNDPDGFVRSAAWVSSTDAVDRLRQVQWYDCVPIERYLSGEALPGAVYRMDRT